MSRVDTATYLAHLRHQDRVYLTRVIVPILERALGGRGTIVGVGGSVRAAIHGGRYADIDLSVRALESSEAAALARSCVRALHDDDRVMVHGVVRESDPDGDRNPTGIVVSVMDFRPRRGRADRNGLFDIDLPRDRSGVAAWIGALARDAHPYVVLDR